MCFCLSPKPVDLGKVLKLTEEALFILYLEQMAEKSPDKPILLAGSESYTPRQIYNEVRKGTPFGKQYYEDLKQTLCAIIFFDVSDM
ncbi:MAG: hypothetical protein GY795_09070 [Desulfobacterales bacterium]|nr:hypothetical protein [Desulfobacterales bacterium]